MPRSPAMPQHGTPLGCTLVAHRCARFMKAALMPILLLLHGTCTATLSFTCTCTNSHCQRDDTVVKTM
jgi:hypothetical protein